jgi:diguanylate cyclase
VAGGSRGGATTTSRDPVTSGLLVLVSLTVLAYAAGAVVRDLPGFVPVLDGWLRVGAYALAVALVGLRVLRVPRDRALWSWVAVAVVARGLGAAGSSLLAGDREPLVHPSVPDASWLVSGVALVVAAAMLARGHRSRTPPTQPYDTVSTGLAVASIAVALLPDHLADVAASGPPVAAAVVDLAHPALDVVLLAVLAGALVVAGRRPPRSVLILAAGVVVLTAADAASVLQPAAGTSQLGRSLAAVALLGTVSLAWAAWADDGIGPERPGRDPQEEPLPRLVAPITAAIACLTVLVVATVTSLPALAVATATAGLLVTIARTRATFRIVRAAAEHRRAARTDDLTGIANRRACTEALAQAIEACPEGGSVGLLVIGLDGFRDVNDTYGHHQGDLLLRASAERLGAALGPDDVLARVGGDEFAAVLGRGGRERRDEVADRLRANLRRPFVVEQGHLTLTASVGSATCPDDADDPSGLLRLADLALYDAKSSPVGHRRYDPDRHRSRESRRRTVDEIQRALQRGELEVHHQPQVDLASGLVTGTEALVRWRHPTHGLLHPDRFLAAAEAGGLMSAVTRYVLERAAERSASWHRAGHALCVSVNVNVTTLLDPTFLAELDEVLAVTGAPPGGVGLELTEDLFLADPDRARRVVEQLLERQVPLFVDDYGTGYSSLGYLRDLHGLTGLKLDRSYVSRIDRDRRTRAIVASTISLARSLDLEVIAEGVETTGIRDTLVHLDCPTAQGHLFSRAIPPDELDLTSVPATAR